MVARIGGKNYVTKTEKKKNEIEVKFRVHL